MLARTVLALLSVVAPSIHAGLPPSIDGSWYSPRQPGHGLLIERVSEDRALLYWHVYDPEGAPLALVVDATIEGRRLYGDAAAPHGMRFGSFDPQALQLPRWGRLVLDFADCANALLHFDAVDPRYGRGTIALTRLLPSRDPACRFDLPSDFTPLAGALLAGEFAFSQPDDLWPLSGEPSPATVDGVVGRDGAWHAHVSYSEGGDTHSPAALLVGTPQEGLPGSARHRVTYYSSDWYCAAVDCGFLRNPLPGEPDALPYEFDLESKLERDHGRVVAAAVVLPGQTEIAGASRPRFYLRSRARPAGGYLSPLESSRSFPARVRVLFDSVDLVVSVSPDGAIAVREAARVLLTGRVQDIDADGFDFELASSDGEVPSYRGRGYLRRAYDGSGSRIELDLFGHNGRNGIALRSSIPSP
jgi:hypothetical protein